MMELNDGLLPVPEGIQLDAMAVPWLFGWDVDEEDGTAVEFLPGCDHAVTVEAKAKVTTPISAVILMFKRLSSRSKSLVEKKL